MAVAKRRVAWALRPRGWWMVVGMLGALVAWIIFLNAILPSGSLYEYRLVTPTEAIRLVNEDGWRVSERVRMTDQAVYLYRRR